jgi:antitoxin component YwqK of YwqJK toxin-antitoxin module
MKQRTFYAIAVIFAILIIIGYVWKDKSKVLLYHPNGKPELLVIEYKEGGHKWKKEVTFHPNGKKHSEGYYRDGMRQGKQMEFYWEGKKIYEYYCDRDKLVGPFRAWNRDGTLSQLDNYRNGKLHGNHRQWRINGQLYIEGSYEEGEKEDRWRTYTLEGKLEKEELYERGKLIKGANGHE